MAVDDDHSKASGNVEAAPTDAFSGKDEAIAMVGEERHVVDPAVEARAVRKIDWFLIPAMIVGCTYCLLFGPS